MKRIRVAALIGVIAIVSAALMYWRWPGAVAAEVYGDQSITVDGVVRRFRLVVPHSLPSASVPIVFAFHGIGDSVESMAEYSELDRLAAENGFVLVYPVAIRSMWVTVKISPDDLNNNLDVRFFDRLLDDLGKRYPIDRRRIYLVGMSNGASFAQIVAFARPKVAAVVAHSGGRPRELRQAVRLFPIMLVAGANDAAADAVRADAGEYRRNGHVARFICIPGLGHEWSSGHNSQMWAFLSGHKFDEH